MHIEIRKGMNLYPSTYNAVIAPERVMISAIKSNADLKRFLLLYIGGNYSRILSGVYRTCGNFDIQRAFHGTPEVLSTDKFIRFLPVTEPAHENVLRLG
jgi:DNA polymerase I